MIGNRTGCIRPNGLTKLEPQRARVETSDGSIKYVPFRRNFELSTVSVSSFELRVLLRIQYDFHKKL